MGVVVCAVVVNWNGRTVIEPCLTTLLASDYPDLEVLVVDNASTDGSLELMAERFPDVRLLANPKNLGYAAGANAGVEVAIEEGAEYVLLMNNDTEIAPDAVARLVEAARDDPAAAFVGPLICYADPPDLIWSLGGRVSYWTGRIAHRALREIDRGQYRTIEPVDYVTGCAVLCSVPAIRRIGPMDEGYFMYNEDTDWCERARGAGFSVLVAPAAKVWHKVSTSSGGGLTSFKIYHRIRSTFRFYRRYARWYHWLGIVPATIGRALWFLGAQLLSGNRRNALAVVRGAADTALDRRRV